MAIIYSTDEKFAKYRKYKSEKNFVCFMKHNDKPSGFINISQNLVRKTALTKKVLVAHDSDTNEILIIPSINGNIKVTITETCAHAGLKKFLLFCGFSEDTLPVGRFKAEVDKNGNILVNLNCPLVNKGEI